MAATSNAVKKELVKERLDISKSFFGKGKRKISRFKREDRLKLHEY